MTNLIPIEHIENKIYLLRGQKVMLDFDLAKLYQVMTKNLNKAISRNRKRFPEDFMFQLTKDEYNSLRFQIGTLKRGQHSKYLPYAFTEQGIAMLSSVLRSNRAIEVNIAIMRTFVRLRQVLANHKELADKLTQLEAKVGKQLSKHDEEITIIFKLIKKMLTVEAKPAKRIGFLVDNEDK
jgi:hypothetical protein